MVPEIPMTLFTVHRDTGVLHLTKGCGTLANSAHLRTMQVCQVCMGSTVRGEINMGGQWTQWNRGVRMRGQQGRPEMQSEPTGQ